MAYFCKRHLSYETDNYLFDKEYITEETEIQCHAKSYAKNLLHIYMVIK